MVQSSHVTRPSSDPRSAPSPCPSERSPTLQVQPSLHRIQHHQSCPSPRRRFSLGGGGFSPRETTSHTRGASAPEAHITNPPISRICHPSLSVTAISNSMPFTETCHPERGLACPWQARAKDLTHRVLPPSPLTHQKSLVIPSAARNLSDTAEKRPFSSHSPLVFAWRDQGLLLRVNNLSSSNCEAHLGKCRNVLGRVGP
jgi:hypothetical protein